MEHPVVGIPPTSRYLPHDGLLRRRSQFHDDDLGHAPEHIESDVEFHERGLGCAGPTNQWGHLHLLVLLARVLQCPRARLKSRLTFS